MTKIVDIKSFKQSSKANGSNYRKFESLPSDIIREIAMDIGKEVVHYIGIMYPKALEASSSTMPLSVRNKIHNEIVATLRVNNLDEIRARLEERKRFRREEKKAWKKIRETEKGGDK